MGLVVGLAIGGLAILVVVSLLFLCCCKKKRRRRDEAGYYMPPPPPAPKGSYLCFGSFYFNLIFSVSMFH